MKKIYFLAFICAVLTAVFVYVYMHNTEKTVVYDSVEATDVVVANVDIPSNTLITQSMVKIEKIPNGATVPSYCSDIKSVVGMVATDKIIAGEQVSRSRLGAIGNATSVGLSYELPNGMRAITISVDTNSGVGGYIKTNDNIDIIQILAEKQSNGTTAQVPSYLCQKVKVIKVGTSDQNQVVAAQPQSTSSDGSTSSAQNQTVQSPSNYQSLTLLVTTKQALAINYALVTGQIRITLRPVTDSSSDNTTFSVPSK
ncbi:MAG: Flp pilus assembly protein CpaB [Bacillota bacterium]|nr:Flp pilus assembly protein CpaB [Bacillota bacterium]